MLIVYLVRLVSLIIKCVLSFCNRRKRIVGTPGIIGITIYSCRHPDFFSHVLYARSARMSFRGLIQQERHLANVYIIGLVDAHYVTFKISQCGNHHRRRRGAISHSRHNKTGYTFVYELHISWLSALSLIVLHTSFVTSNAYF